MATKLDKDIATFQNAGMSTFFTNMLGNPDPVLKKANMIMVVNL